MIVEPVEPVEPVSFFEMEENSYTEKSVWTLHFTGALLNISVNLSKELFTLVLSWGSSERNIQLKLVLRMSSIASYTEH